MSLSVVYGSRHYPETVSFADARLNEGAVGKNEIEAAADIEASKLQHRYVISYAQPVVPDTVTDESMVLHICRGAGTVIAIEVTSAVAPDADTDYVTIDVNRVRAGTAHTVMTGDITYNKTTAMAGAGGNPANGNYGIVTGTLDGSYTALLDNDVITVDITHTDNGGTNASGITVNITIDESL